MRPRAPHRRLASPREAFAAAILAVLLFLAALYAVRQVRPIPTTRQTPGRIQELRDLDPQRSATVRIRAIEPAPPARADSMILVRYSLASPASRVEDAEIRGLLAGEIKYDFNQGSANHMRVGRRFAGPSRGLYELKRALVRWELPRLPEGSRVVSAEATFWIESFDLGSPLARKGAPVALHLYAYPIDQEWVQGEGGKRKDNFSSAARGEVSWTDVRSQEGPPWPSPGALEPAETGVGGYLSAPVAVAAISGSDRPLALSGAALTSHVAACERQGRPLDLLLKLDDVEEDRPGTEISLLTSEFGDVHDARSKRPRLDLVVEVPGRDFGREEPVVVEPGGERILAPVEHRGRTVLLAAEVSDAGGAIPAGVFLRGGLGAPSPDSSWQPLTLPVERRWDWSQVKIASPPWRVPLGTTAQIALREFWVQPGPRRRQLPELVLVAPSGTVRRIRGEVASGDEYRLSFRPTEPGLWRYGWSFRTTPSRPPAGHEGEGLFYVTLPGQGGASELADMRSWVAELVAENRGAPPLDADAEQKVDALCRWAASYSRGATPEERSEAERLVEEARASLGR
ncbi:MAG TPA: hypothetical protein VF363_04170 [Candidatus Eisenbacteria bacterium]